MPISSIDKCDEAHWGDVKAIIESAVKSVGFHPNLVSNANEVRIIQKNIIENLYKNPIVVCDVSCKNANVMFELGMRLAFNKPTVIIKDECTDFAFDTAPIEHLPYPRDLRYNAMVDFKQLLAIKVKSTYEASQNSDNYTTFLGHFGKFSTVNLDAEEISQANYIIEELQIIKSLLIDQIVI